VVDTLVCAVLPGRQTNLKVVTTYAKALVETLAEKPNRVIFSGKPAKLSQPEAEFLKATSGGRTQDHSFSSVAV
jgi:hypothetical protein